ncbi:MAG TPA: hypothetical protein VN830_07065 [Verrucomicrobiae bacterium]|nr:hypothetical protein [Verrucomicrobiae bacterium]
MRCIRIMEWNKLRNALDPGESMFARRTLMQLATKLAIGLGALFLVGVLLAAIPNHRAPVVEGLSANPGQEALGTDPAMVPVKMGGAKSNEKDGMQGAAHKDDGNSAPEYISTSKAGDSPW